MSEILPVTCSYIQEKDGTELVISDEAFYPFRFTAIYANSERQNLEKPGTAARLVASSLKY